MRAGFGTTLLVLDFPREDRCHVEAWDTSARALVRAARETGSRAAIVASLPECMPEARAQEIAGAGVIPFQGLEEALAALRASATVHRLWQRPVAELPLAPATIDGPAALYSEWEGKQLLREAGLSVPRGAKLAHGAGMDAVRAAMDSVCAPAMPLVLKAVGRRIAHKTEIGAVRLGLLSREAVGEAAASLAGVGEHLLLEQMVTDAVAELLIGVNRDPVFGLHLVLGAGGQLVEWIEDSAVLLLPSSREAVHEAILGLRCARLLQGYRNRPRGDLHAVVDAVMAVQAFALAHADRLAELDINPLMVRPEGHGAMAADVLLRMSGIGKPEDAP
jgi:acyl-CoA synthetase (NDP forming)